MIGAQGFRARAATANYKRRVRKLVPDEVRAARFANLHGLVVETPAPAQPEPEVTDETKVDEVVEQVGEATEAAEDNSAEGSGSEGAEHTADETDASDPKAEAGKPAKASKSKAKKK